ncbi:MAG TPA: histidine kinase [Gemmatimonadaceae bacterium]|nr:histidine kinase [Gemmatimonadaceae bacterium]
MPPRGMAAGDASLAPPFSPRDVLAVERDRAERALNGVRIVVLLLLGGAALLYAPLLTPALNRTNVAILVPTLAWAVVQVPLFHRRRRLPAWLSIANPILDITAVSCIIGGYALASTPMLALKTPIITAYFIILAALPVASSTRKAAIVSALAVVEYAALVVGFAVSGRLALVANPVLALGADGVSPLDEGARLFLLACAGAVATYATQWQEQLWTRYAEVSRASEQLQAQLDQAQLQTLKLQLHPHFLFNTLNAITALIHRAPDRAERMVAGLSELLRISLGSAAEQEVPLSREIEVLEHYVDIQQERFQGRLVVRLDVAPDVREALVPNLILQPLVENAIKHGIGPRAAGGTVEVAARRSNDALLLVVRDDGVGEPVPQLRREGVGLANSRARLTSLYGEGHRLTAGAGATGGFEVSIVIPFHTEPAARLVAAGIDPD